MILVGITHVLDDVLFQPFVLGSAVSIHPLVVVVAIIGGSLIMGIWGMVFAIPTVVVVKTVVETLFKEFKDYHMIYGFFIFCSRGHSAKWRVHPSKADG